jgi:hypothetical protein
MESDRLSASETLLHNLLTASKLIIKSVPDQQWALVLCFLGDCLVLEWPNATSA